MELLIVGLGNIPFPATRHSVGHFIVDSLAARLGAQLTYDRRLGGFSARASTPIGDKSVGITLFKPKSLMNISGPPIATALRGTVVVPSSMVVIHDSLSHKPATVSSKFGGSANGHNGVRSIISALGGDMDFHRLRIGIGKHDGDAAEYVLGRLPGFERLFWSPDGQGIDLVWNALETIVKKSGKSA